MWGIVPMSCRQLAVVEAAIAPVFTSVALRGCGCCFLISYAEAMPTSRFIGGRYELQLSLCLSVRHSYRSAANVFAHPAASGPHRILVGTHSPGLPRDH